ncbi:MAG: hypothetical protein WAK55_30305, partial [Xanthobacteraceae bacterium]
AARKPERAMARKGHRMIIRGDFGSKVRNDDFSFQYGYLDLQTAINELRRYANGIVGEQSQDEVQRIISAAFADIEREPAA